VNGMRSIGFSVPLLLVVAVTPACGGSSSDAAPASPLSDAGPADDGGTTPDTAGGADAADAADAAPIPVLPTSPADVVAKANVTQGGRLSWTAPSVGGPITGYAVAVSPPGGTVRVAATGAVISGLTVGQSYTFTVSATNASGAGPSSAPSTAVVVVDGPAPPAGFVACGADQITNLRANVKILPGGSKGITYQAYFGATVVSMLTPSNVAVPALPFVHTGRTNAAALHYVLTAIDQMGTESLESAEDTTTPDSAVHDSFFVHSYAGVQQSIEIVDCFGKVANGATPPARLIKGPTTGITTSDYNRIAVDGPRGLIYYRNPGSLLVFGNATTVTGDVAPTRKVEGSMTQLTGGRGMANDPTRDLLYLVNSSAILVFTGASAADGNAAPARVITGASTGLTNPFSLSLDVANDRLHVANGTDILVFNGASAATGDVAPSRSVHVSGETQLSFGVSIDATKDLLYSSSRNSGAIHTIAAAATATGTVPALNTITGLDTPMGIAVVSDRLFMLTDNGSTKVSLWSNAGTATGALAPDKIVNFPTVTAAGGFAYAR
jgi:hypothetical protein